MIYFDGDSNTQGAELLDEVKDGFPFKVVQRLGRSDFINGSVSGCGNYEIMRRVDLFLYECKKSKEFPELIVIGWTNIGRESWYHKGSYKTVCSCSLPEDEAREIDSDRVDLWKENSSGDNIQFKIALAHYWSNAIYNLHCELSELNIPHVFFHACKNFYFDIDLALERDPRLNPNRRYEYDWNNCFIEPMNNSFSMNHWVHDRGHKPTQWLHYDADAHTEFADFLYDYIKQYNLYP